VSIRPCCIVAARVRKIGGSLVAAWDNGQMGEGVEVDLEGFTN
jgi:hypothetical protein